MAAPPANLAAPPGQTACRVIRLGRAGYDDAYARMKAEAAKVASGSPAALILFECKPIVTAGRGFKEAHLVEPPAYLAARGVPFQRVDRGGSVTVHAPGQWTVYPVFPLGRFNRDIHRFVRGLEEVGLQVAAAFGVHAHREKGRTGVWTDQGKLMSIGIGVSRWVTFHGLCLNVHAAPPLFDWVIPCGIQGCRPIGLEEVLGEPIAMEDAERALLKAFSKVFSLEFSRS